MSGSSLSLVGSTIRVWWEHDRKWYRGVVKAFNEVSLLHTVVYDDGDQQAEALLTGAQLAKCTWEMVASRAPRGPATPSPACLAPHPSPASPSTRALQHSRGRGTGRPLTRRRARGGGRSR